MEEENINETFSTDLNLIDQNKISFYSEEDIPTELELPYPPEIKASELVKDLLSRYETKSPKMLNEFFIYRKAYVQAFKKQNLRPKMTQVSSLASASWHRESSDVKNAYRKIAREAEQLYINERKKRQQRQQSQTTDKMQTSDSEVTSTSTSPEPPYDPVSSPSNNMGNNTFLNTSNQDKLSEFSNVSSTFNGSYGPTSYENNFYNIFNHETSIPVTNGNFGPQYQPIFSYNSGQYFFNNGESYGPSNNETNEPSLNG
ncbi:MATA-HMG [Gigaspora margarita]|uniref:MATA-HMG n=1 Tax=Gigaspora margarita TaxID=4874 RepID=A0A8H3XE40_GIGMA|nr:MATA-HMG [Gigaspora margarita]